MHPNDSSFFKPNSGLVKFLADGDRISNLIYGLPFIYERYSQSIAKIIVELNLNESSGTGFLFRVLSPKANSTYSFIITNKHVVEPSVELKVLINDTYISHSSVFLSDFSDLAAILVDCAEVEGFPVIHFNERIHYPMDVITIGYPSIPGATFQKPLVHSGEINGEVIHYLADGDKDCIVFSAKTSSGNSGSPILDLTGSCVGIISKELFSEADFQSKGKLPYYGGIKSSRIRQFLNEEVLKVIYKKSSSAR